MTPELEARFRALVADRDALDGDAAAPKLVEPRGLYRGKAALALTPRTVEQVSAILALAYDNDVAVVPQGGNTGLVGGQTPSPDGAQILLSTAKLDRIREVDAGGALMVAEAGVTLQRAQEAAAEAGRLFPLSLGSEGSCTIGGNIATNAGGTAVLAYGNMRDLVLGVEAVLPDGRIWNGLRRLRKDNTGYDLKHLFIGSEGTLGVVTAAVLKLYPAPRETATALAGLASPQAAVELFRIARAHAGPTLTGCELMPRIGLDFTFRHMAGTRDPLEGPHPWYILLELSSPLEGGLAETLETILGEAFEAGVVEDAAIAASGEQAQAFWRIRHGLSEVQGHEGGSIKHDVSVPLSSVAEFVTEATAAVADHAPDARVVAFGHIGDGNIHFNVSQPVGADKAAYLAGWDAMNRVVHAVVARYGGSVAAEHGVGRLKRGLLAEVKSDVELDLMRAVKRALDPKGLLNPGAILSETRP
ncbi:D-2-hydroxyacid dehydrogenase [Methylopila jiangsuensis]|uniref:D-2-hydroxyacid dehydrogenase n=1 Tax=Methylopila jiangsuensis TaxID=586230 RepID=A0A9W6JFC7_9HYPH|nr:FAD-binding oxidoreductase [Methylopila jiangsuensis]MDR6284281.1 FAD/FMN-containing dehydrogenase [Methylopila jiangsuensis]GLK76202.1 D-2-hydroxyacid dehydrogenase [Methylopila jiangsuensis]